MPAPHDETVTGAWRFSMKSLLLLPIISLVFIYIVCSILDEGSSARGVGHANFTLRFIILDSATNTPVAGTSVSLYDPDNQLDPPRRAESSDSGEIELTWNTNFYLVGGSRLRNGKALVPLSKWCFAVSAQGYQPARYWLSEFTGRMHDLERSPGPAPIVVRLNRAGTQ